MQMKRLHSAAEGGKWQIGGLVPCGQNFAVAAVMM